MNEQKKVCDAIQKVQSEKRKAVLATVVNVRGSAYRREGAKMLIDENGLLTGMISGGCLESDVAESAKQVLQTGKSLRKTYDMDEDLVWGLGLGCPGTVDLFMEVISKDDKVLNESLTAWMECISHEREGTLATIMEEGEASVGKLFIEKEKGFYSTTGTFHDIELENQVVNLAKQKLSDINPKSETFEFVNTYGKSVEVFMDIYQPPLHLIIFGAGHDAIPVAQYGVSLGMRVTVVDQRFAYNSAERFPKTERIITTTENISNKVNIGERSYVIIMNHHLEKDRETLKFTLQSNAPYIGVLGPLKRRKKIMETLKEEGYEYSDSQLSRMYSPIGLNIGAVTPEEIAVSILSEIIAVSKGYPGGFLSGREHIHQVAP